LILELFRQCGSFLFDFGIVPIVCCFCFSIWLLSEQSQNIKKQKLPHCRNSSKIKQKNKNYHTVGIVPKSNRKTKPTTLSEQFQNQIEKQKQHTIGTIPKSNRKLPHCHSVVVFYFILELFRQCGSFYFSIWFWNCSDSVVVFVFLFDFGTVPKLPHCRNSSKI
jgi:hypothetical protein